MGPPYRESGTCHPATLGSKSGVLAEAVPAVLQPLGLQMAYQQVRRLPSCDAQIHEWRAGLGDGNCSLGTLESASGIPQGGAMVLWCGPPADRPRASAGGGEPMSWRLGAMVHSAAAARPQANLRTE